MKKNKLLVICGPTATGKTSLALRLAKRFDGEIISADSRQVYKYMDIGTGKDLPVQFKIQNSKFRTGGRSANFYTDGESKIWGYDLVEPGEEFSVSQYVSFVSVVISDVQKRDKLPILVGGTGLYIKGVLKEIETIDIKPNKKLRKELGNKSPQELFGILHKLNPGKANSLNDSDKRNPVRLIRAIEIIKNSRLKIKNYNSKLKSYDTLWIGLRLDRNKLSKRIKERVEERIDRGFEKEYKRLIKKYGKLELFNKTPGYKHWPDVGGWVRSEIKYAKRQATWFRRNKDINWFGVDEEGSKKRLENLVQKWYSSS